MNIVRIIDNIDEIDILNEIRIRLANEFEPLTEVNLLTYATDLVDEKLVKVIKQLKLELKMEE